jgi:preprotein translocase subunit YajC
MDFISWSVLIPVLVVVAILYFLVRTRRKGRETNRRRG